MAEQLYLHQLQKNFPQRSAHDDLLEQVTEATCYFETMEFWAQSFGVPNALTTIQHHPKCSIHSTMSKHCQNVLDLEHTIRNIS